jgi:hypothetical protein
LWELMEEIGVQASGNEAKGNSAMPCFKGQTT